VATRERKPPSPLTTLRQRQICCLAVLKQCADAEHATCEFVTTHFRRRACRVWNPEQWGSGNGRKGKRSAFSIRVGHELQSPSQQHRCTELEPCAWFRVCVFPTVFGSLVYSCASPMSSLAKFCEARMSRRNSRRRTAAARSTSTSERGAANSKQMRTNMSAQYSPRTHPAHLPSIHPSRSSVD